MTEYKSNITSDSVIPCHNPSGIVCIDTETTGLKFYNDEILQISMVDGDGNVLLNSLVKPTTRKRWPSATEVNGITPQMVKDAPKLLELAPQIRGIFDSAEILIGYNLNFDLDFVIEGLPGILKYIHPKTRFDVMLKFAEVYGQWDSYHEDYKWQKLTKCASHYGFDWTTTGTHAHDSLGDALATLYCYKFVKEDIAKKQEQKEKLRKMQEMQKLSLQKNNKDFLDANAKYFNPGFREDVAEEASSFNKDLNDYQLSVDFISPTFVLILSILFGLFAVDRIYLAIKTRKSKSHDVSSMQMALAILKMLSWITVIGILIWYIIDVFTIFFKTIKINEENLLADVGIIYYHGRL